MVDLKSQQHILGYWQHRGPETRINTHINEFLCRLIASCCPFVGKRLLCEVNADGELPTYFYNSEDQNTER